VVEEVGAGREGGKEVGGWLVWSEVEAAGLVEQDKKGEQ
jgi:hypothetical protein